MNRLETDRQPYPEYYQYEEEEINLLDYVIVMLKRKWMIFFIVLFAGIFGVVYSLLATEMYRSECTIVPVEQAKASLSNRISSAFGGFGAMIASQVGIGGSGSLEKFEVVLKSREFTNGIVNEHNLMPVLYSDIWNEKEKKWEADEPPTMQDAYKKIQEGLLSVSPDIKKNVMRLSFDFADPATAKRILGYFVTGLSDYLRKQELENAYAQKMTLQRELAETVDPLLKNKLTEIIAQYVEKETLARVQKYYGFNVIDPPFSPEKRFSPNRRRFCVLCVLVAFFLAVMLAFGAEYLENMRKNEDPERMASLKRYIRLRNS